MLNPTPQSTYLRDYQPPAFLIPTVELDVSIDESATRVSARLSLKRNPDSPDPSAPLVLNGDELELLAIALDGVELSTNAYDLQQDSLTVHDLPDTCEIRTEVGIHPETNTQLMGLYASKDGYFTQCEAEGFRRITFFLDRPDVMSRYTTTIHADRNRFPLLLSNGNLQEQGDESGDRHWARWVDPFPKPAYLFAMVAAKLDKIEDDFVTASGRPVKLLVYVEPGKSDQAGFAMESLKAAMRWDEQTYGLELDLDQYMIVAVSDFNMGAMENKGLNIFNTKYVLASPDTATDMDFMMLDRVVAHEYFHNWTGNRVTCRDWFQLSLKEGLTVFRDQRYGEDRYSESVQRIQEVRSLRMAQFPEDAGPMAHPVRPDAYMEISNFYTATVYNKGAEVVRMIQTLIGAESFRRGMDLYFERHDGQAVRTEDFVSAMQDASGVDLTQFQRWYSQAGTPKVTAVTSYDPTVKELTIELEQTCPATPGQDRKEPFHIPVAFGLIDENGKQVAIDSAGNSATVLSLTEPHQTYTFQDVPANTTPSFLRHFSAPVNFHFDYAEENLAHLMAYDEDPFNRWEAGQRLALKVLLNRIDAIRTKSDPTPADGLIEAMRRTLTNASEDPAFAAEAMSLPGAAYIAEQLDEVDPDAILAARDGLRREIAERLGDELHATRAQVATTGEPYTPDAASAGRRALSNACLSLLMELETPEIIHECMAQLTGANNMTDAMAALAALANCACRERDDALSFFYDKWRHEPLVVDKWFSVQAASRLPDTFTRVNSLLNHPAFDIKNPNKVRAVIGAFCHANHAHFNAADGSGYAFAADQIIALDGINAQIAARLARAFDRWRKFDAARQVRAEAALARIRATDGLSKDTLEVVANALSQK